MLKIPALLNLRATASLLATTVSTEDIDRLKHDYKRRLASLRVLPCSNLIIQLRRRQGSQVRGVRGRDRYPFGYVRLALDSGTKMKGYVKSRGATDMKSGREGKGQNSNLRFRNLMAPSRHSGLSSLSPNEPSSSLTMISPCSGTWIMRISPYNSSTLSRHSFCFRLCSLQR